MLGPARRGADERLYAAIRDGLPGMALRAATSPPIVGAALLGLDELGAPPEAHERARAELAAPPAVTERSATHA